MPCERSPRVREAITALDEKVRKSVWIARLETLQRVLGIEAVLGLVGKIKADVESLEPSYATFLTKEDAELLRILIQEVLRVLSDEAGCDELWLQTVGRLGHARRLDRQDAERGTAGRDAGPAADQVRVGDQPQSGACYRHRDPALDPRPRRRRADGGARPQGIRARGVWRMPATAPIGRITSFSAKFTDAPLAEGKFETYLHERENAKKPRAVRLSRPSCQ